MASLEEIHNIYGHEEKVICDCGKIIITHDTSLQNFYNDIKHAIREKIVSTEKVFNDVENYYKNYPDKELYFKSFRKMLITILKELQVPFETVNQLTKNSIYARGQMAVVYQPNPKIFNYLELFDQLYNENSIDKWRYESVAIVSDDVETQTKLLSILNDFTYILWLKEEALKLLKKTKKISITLESHYDDYIKTSTEEKIKKAYILLEKNIKFDLIGVSLNTFKYLIRHKHIALGIKINKMGFIQEILSKYALEDLEKKVKSEVDKKEINNIKNNLYKISPSQTIYDSMKIIKYQGELYKII